MLQFIQLYVFYASTAYAAMLTLLLCPCCFHAIGISFALQEYWMDFDEIRGKWSLHQ